MCGIFGIWNRDGAPVDVRSLERATTSLRHRGPDDEGYLLADTRGGRTVLCAGDDTTSGLALPHLRSFAGEPFDLAFGFRRLSILDLSPAGHQPMSGAGGRHWIVFNGEIYNFVELRSELEAFGHRFRSGSDTEVILAAYAQWGTAAVERLRGMFALAIWDAGERRLFLARDRFGIKPLYLARKGATVAFASEIKALATAGAVELRPDRVAAGVFAALGFMPPVEEGATFFEDVRSLPAAHASIVDARSFATSRYWSVPPAGSQPTDPAAEVSRYARSFDDSLRLHLRSDVPLGTCLSGGLDSSSIVARTARLIADLHSEAVTGFVPRTFSAVYSSEGPWNERPHIDAVLARTGAEGHFVEPRPDELIADLPRLIWHQEEPFATTSIFAQWCVMRLARQTGVTVLLDGQGADEVLGGYHSFFGAYLRGTLAHSGMRAARARAAEIEQVTGTRLPVGRELLRSMPGGDALAIWRRKRVFRAAVARASLSDDLQQDVVRSAVDSFGSAPVPHDLRADLTSALQSGSLPHLLRYEDRNSMAFSIEARVPFLDHPLVEGVFASPVEVRIRDGWTKWVARKAIERDLPDSITWRRDKVGFATPEQQWLAGNEEVRALLEPASTAAWFNGRVPAAEFLWRHAVVGAWLTHFVRRARATA